MMSFRSLFRSAAAAPRRSFSTTPINAYMAKVTLIGRLASDPELYTSASGVELVKYAVGTSYRTADKEYKTAWWRVACFNESSKPYVQTLTKGTLVCVEGDLSLTPYESEDGKKHNHINVTHRNIKVITRAPREGEEGHEGHQEGREGHEGHQESREGGDQRSE